jgi:hypothetical protein
MAEGPDQVCICYRCIQSCATIIQAEYERLGNPLPRNQLHEDARTREQINSIVAEVAQLSKSEVSLSEFYVEFTRRIVTALAASGGAVWTMDANGHLALTHFASIEEAGLAESVQNASGHTSLLYEILSNGKGILVPPHAMLSSLVPGDLDAVASNPTDYLLVFGVLVAHGETVGLIEIFQRSGAGPDTQSGYLRFVAEMCDLAGYFLAKR